MFSDYRRGFIGFLLAMMVTYFSGTVHAQYPNYLLEPGTPTFTTPEPVPMGIINVANGNLHIEIPFVSTPQQRGGTLYVGKMIYDSRIYKIVDDGSSQYWSPTNIPGSVPYVSGGFGYG